MADATRLFAEFKDDQGTDWRVNIHDEDFVGSATEFTLGADGFVLRYSGDNENRYESVIGSEVTFTLVEQTATETTFMDLLSTSAEQRFSVSIRKDPDSTNTLWWGGVILPEQVVRPDEFFPIMNTINAADDLGNLEVVDYNNDGTAYTLSAPSCVEHVLNCLNKTRAAHLWGTDDFLYYVNDFKSVDYTGTNQLLQSSVSQATFYNTDDEGVKQYYPSFQVLENFALVFNARIFQSEGKWWFLPVGAQQNSTTLTVEGAQKDGTVITQQSIAAGVPFSTTFVKLNGYEFTHLTPAKEVTRARRYDGNSAMIFDSAHLKAEFGTVLADTDFDYPADTTMAISGVFNYEFEGDGTTTGNGRIGRVELQFRLQCGTKYLKRDVTYTGTSQEWYMEPGTLLEYTGNTNGAASWETSAEKWYEVSQTFDINAGTNFSVPFFLTLPALPDDQTGLDLTVTIRGVNNTGGTATSLTGATSNYSITLLRVDLIGDSANGDQTNYTAVNSDSTRFKIDQGEALLGDEDSLNAQGVIRLGVGVASTGWQGLNYTGTGLGINRLGVQEVLAGQRKATRVQRGEIFGSEIPMYKVIDDTDGDYAIFELTFTARPVYTQLEAWKLNHDDTTISTDTGETVNISTPITQQFTQSSGGVYEAINRSLGIHEQNYGSRQMTTVTARRNIAGASYTVLDTDYMIFNFWSGANGMSRIVLPQVDDSQGRTIQFHSDSTISANTYIQLEPDAGDTSATIDGAANYAFNRSYDGITILCHGGNWYIIQERDK